MKLQTLKQNISDFIKDEEGLTTVEYAIAGSLVGLFVVAAFTDLGEEVEIVIQGLADSVGTAAN